MSRQHICAVVVESGGACRAFRRPLRHRRAVLVGISSRNSPRGRTPPKDPTWRVICILLHRYRGNTAAAAAASITGGPEDATGNRPDVPAAAASFLRRGTRTRAQMDERGGLGRRGIVKSRLRDGGIFRVTKLDWQFIGDIRLRSRSVASCTRATDKNPLPSGLHRPAIAAPCRCILLLRYRVRMSAACPLFISRRVARARARVVSRNRLVWARHESEVFSDGKRSEKHGLNEATAYHE